jgi:hypothetical protein
VNETRSPSTEDFAAAASRAAHLSHDAPNVPFVDPATALGEILFGLVMTLTFTLTAGMIIESEGRDGARELLIAIIGCNIAWGVIDAALYMAGELLDRGRLRKLGLAIRVEPDPSRAADLVEHELSPLLGDVLAPADGRSLYLRIAQNLRQRSQQTLRVTRDDWMGALMSFILVVVSSLPAALPFLIFDNTRFALRVSNAILVAGLFLSGYWWSKYTLGRPWLVGLSFLGVGMLLVIVAIALGG